ncbi:MAG: Threonine-tRNA ligase [Candidatus Falkowbacteria bacterium GW2011_GWF2_39_8]|uniref:Threonine--tRNA ligase n=1 Tax=Candidatus Falkowbacteria bacterium GW2011_GWF2_39_8 TaxID=1618642 RepID=A0A0G0PVN7_9BACT|nr:MAG: Threonine-tRNA ligase [Candidatus Falkowbacteria bacterium GW2011_GWF2_39_8]
MNNQNQQLETVRHSLSHLLAAAVKQLYPEAKFSIGPSIENGFYYDIDFGETKINDESLKEIEKKMAHLIKQNLKFEKFELPIDEAIAKEKESGEIYKQELIEDLKTAGETTVSYYTVGDFTDLCRGPHIENTNKIVPGSFKLNKLAGAYWRGDEKNKMLTRIYGLAFLTREELGEYLTMIEEAEKRDHRRVGKELDLIMMHDIAPGMPFFLPKGMIVLNELIKFVREHSYGEGYREVRTPQILNSELWKTSGHWGHYKEDMFCIHHEEDNAVLGVKPMNCPAHMLIFKRDIRSYKDLPLRIAETTTLYRNEKSGTLHGLTRVRSISQDDTHIFTTSDSLLEEISKLLDKIKFIYKIFDLKIDEIHLSTRPESFLGEKEDWDKAEDNLKEALRKAELAYQINEGDGAFYGPKIDVKVKDVIGRQWQLATIQLDYQMPQRFELEYIDEDGKAKTPIVIHRALLGSMERFLGILIENYAGAFPVWLSPVQVKLISVGEGHISHCQNLAEELKSKGIRAEVDSNNETVGNKTRKAVNEKVPYILVIGDKEMESDKLVVRDRGSRETREIGKEEFFEEVVSKINNRN